MKITRTMPDEGWVPVANAAARDHRLSWRARGLLLELLSYPDGWETNVDKLVDLGRQANGHAEGRDAMRTAMAELVQAGYVRRLHLGDQRGRWTTELEVCDRRTEIPASVGQASESRSSAGQSSGSQSVTTKTDSKTDTKTDLLKSSDQHSESLASLAVAAGTATREEEAELHLKKLYDRIDDLTEAARRDHLLRIERRRPRIYRDARNAAIAQIKRDEPKTLTGSLASRVIDKLSYKYVAQHYAGDWPAWFSGPLLSSPP